MDKRHMAIRFSALVVLLSVLIAGAIACTEVDASGPDEPAADAVQRFFTTLTEGNLDEANTYLEGEGQNVYALFCDTQTEMGVYVTKVVSRLEFSIEDNPVVTTESAGTMREVVKQPDEQTVKVHVTSVDVPLLFEKTMQHFSDLYADSLMENEPIPDEELEQRLYAMLEEKLETGDVPYLNGYIDVPVVWDGEQWRIQADSTLYNAVTGNYLQIMTYACSNPAGALAEDS